MKQARSSNVGFGSSTKKEGHGCWSEKTNAARHLFAATHTIKLGQSTILARLIAALETWLVATENREDGRPRSRAAGR